LPHQQGADQRHILAGPARVLGQFGPHPRALVETVVAPHVQDLIERPDLGRPIAFELAVVVFADVTRNGARDLDHVAERARLYGVGSQFVEHGCSPRFLIVGHCWATRATKRCTALAERSPSPQPSKSELSLVSTPQERGEGEERCYSAACALISPDTCRMARASCSAGCAPETAYFCANT